MIHVAPGIVIGENEIEMSFIRASGPGGQNVNKVATAVQLRFDAARSPGLTREVLERLRTLAGRRMSADGVLVLTARGFRSQERNRRDAIERLVALLREAARPVKKRKATRPTHGSRLRRLEGKRQRGEVKRGRGKVDFT